MSWPEAVFGVFVVLAVAAVFGFASGGVHISIERKQRSDK